jgi:hypothetical protein
MLSQTWGHELPVVLAAFLISLYLCRHYGNKARKQRLDGIDQGDI